MASISSLSLSAVLFAPCSSSSLSPRPLVSFPSFSSKLLKPSPISSSRVSAAPEALVDSATDEGEAPSALSVDADSSDKVAPQQKIRIKLKSYWVPLIEDSCKQIMDVARTTNAKTMGPLPLPTKKKVYCILKSPHVNKDARYHFEIRTHHRVIDILYPTAQTIDSLMQLDLPSGVDVEVKL